MDSAPPPLADLERAAREYCRLIEYADCDADVWLRSLALLLPRIHAAVESLRVWEPGEPPLPSQDLEARFELFSRLRHCLGERDSYWLEFDAAPQPLTGSLADDLADIYFDLRHGLELLERERPERAAHLWQSSYRLHWGQHLVDAERHLYSLRVRR